MQVKYFDGEIKQEFITDSDNEIAKEALKTVQLVKNRFDKYEVARQHRRLLISQILSTNM